MGYLKANLKLVLYGLAAVVAAFGAGCLVGYWEGKKNSETPAIKRAVKVKEKQDEIRNNRPDDVQLVKRLRGGTF